MKKEEYIFEMIKAMTQGKAVGTAKDFYNIAESFWKEHRSRFEVETGNEFKDALLHRRTEVLNEVVNLDEEFSIDETSMILKYFGNNDIYWHQLACVKLSEWKASGEYSYASLKGLEYKLGNRGLGIGIDLSEYKGHLK
jgi:hypothetical protein